MTFGEAQQAGPALRVVFGDDVGRVYVLGDAEVLIGRSPACHVFLDQPSVSRVHAKIVRAGERLLIRDCCSVNGTHLDDVRVTEATLPDRAHLKIGRTIFEVLARHPTEGAPVPPSGAPPPSSAPPVAHPSPGPGWRPSDLSRAPSGSSSARRPD